MAHDQLFKDLLRSFSPDFLRLVAANAAGALDLPAVRFLDKETFTDLPRGEQRELDLLAEVHFREGSESSKGSEGSADTGLVHVEIEARHQAGIGARLQRYAWQVRLRHDKPVLSILLTLRGGAAGVRIETLTEDRFRMETDRFHYLAFGLSGSRAADYLARPQPLAWGLASLMRRGEASRAAHKLACLKRIAAAKRLSRARRYLLVNCVETYLELSAEEAAEYQRMQAAKGNREVRKMALTWAEKLIAEGEKRGIEKGIAKGVTKGMEKGTREVVLRLLRRRFGPLPREVRRRVEAISSVDALSRLADQVLVAHSLEEMGLA